MSTANELIRLVEEGALTWELIARAAINYMTDAELTEMAHHEELIQEDEEPEDDIELADTARVPGLTDSIRKKAEDLGIPFEVIQPSKVSAADLFGIPSLIPRRKS